MCVRNSVYIDQYMQMSHGGPVVRDAHLLEWLQNLEKEGGSVRVAELLPISAECPTLRDFFFCCSRPLVKLLVDQQFALFGTS